MFDEKTCGSSIKNENLSDQKLTEKLRKPIIRKFNNIKVQSPFVDNVQGADLVDMQLVTKFNKGFRFFAMCY